MVVDIMAEGIMAAAGAMVVEAVTADPVSAFISAPRFILILTTATLTGTRIIYPPAVITVPVTPPVYIQQAVSQQLPPQPQSNYWHYCQTPGGLLSLRQGLSKRLAASLADTALTSLRRPSMSRFFIVFPATFILAVTGCASMPNGPSVMVLPGTGMSFDQFRNDDVVCQQFAFFQVGGTTASQAAVNSGVTSATVGTALGVAAGAAFGGGSGAAIGAGSGLWPAA